MVRFLEWAVANAVVVAVLAPVCFALGRWCRRPALRHALWIVLLLKLITPPLVPVSLEFDLASLLPEPTPAPATTVAKENRIELATTSDRLSISQNVTMIESSSDTNPTRERGSSEAVPRSRVGLVSDESTTSVVGDATARSPAVVAQTTADREWSRSLWRALLLVWLAGSVLLVSVQGARLWRFRRRVGRSGVGSRELSDETRDLAEQLGLRRFPQPMLVSGVVSPMLWGLGRSARILFPVELFDQLSPSARGTLLLHELSHFCRGDHWVRLLEFAALALFWWHPAVWLALHEIEVAEEECCDAWVTRRSPYSARCYAEALLDTIDFLCERHAVLPPVASGLGGPRDLRERLQRIMSDSATTALPRSRTVLCVLAILLPLQPTVFAGLSDSLRELVRFPSAQKSRSTDERLMSPQPSEPVPVVIDINAKNAPDMANALPIGAASPALRLSKEWANAVSADGRFRVVARTGQRVELRDLRSGRTSDLTEWNIASVAFLPSSDLFVTGGFDRQVRLWDSVSGRVIRTLGEHSESVASVAVSSNGEQIVSGSRDGMLTLWSLIGGEGRHELKLDSPIACVRFSPDGETVAVATGSWRSTTSGGIALVDVSSWSLRSRIETRAPIGSLAFIEDGEVVAAGAWDGTVTYLRVSDQEWLASILSSKDAISAAAFSADTHVFPALSLREAIGQAELERQRTAEPIEFNGVLPAE